MDNCNFFARSCEAKKRSEGLYTADDPLFKCLAAYIAQFSPALFYRGMLFADSCCILESA